MPARILIVEDETKIAVASKKGLEAADYEVAVAHTGEDGLFLTVDPGFDLLVLDVMLPGRSGLDVLAAMRRPGLDTPVLILTARDAVEDRVSGLDHGADDYLTKPFAFAELLARVRAEGGRVVLAPEPVDLRQLALDVVVHLGPLAEERELRVVVEGDQDAPAHADRVVLRQAVVNVLDNAIKYSPLGATIRLVVHASPEVSALAVVDTGPGIAPEHHARVFDRFCRVDAARSRAAGGFGLGLAIARWAVEAHRGSLVLESEEGRGSTFWIRLPAPQGVLARS